MARGRRRRSRRCSLGLRAQQGRQVGVGEAHSLGHLNHSAFVERERVAFVQRFAVLAVRVAEEVARLVVHHNAAVEGVEGEEAILPPFLFAPHVVGEQAAEFGNGRGVGRGGSHAR